MKYYPVFLNINRKKAVVVGGGAVAERKVRALLKAGASVTVISPVLTRKLLGEKEKKNIRHICRTYRHGDLKGSFLVIAATDSPSVNSQIAKDAPSLVNVADVPEACTFIAPSIVQRGPLTLAVSTGGASPALSRAIRKELEHRYGAEIGRYLNFVKAIRKKALAGIRDTKARERFLKDLASEKTLQRLRSGGGPAVMQDISSRFEKLVSPLR